MSRSVRYIQLTAFTANAFGGNPAAVVFLDEDVPDTATLGKIALNLNQPVTAFISPPPTQVDTKTATFGIRWFSNAGGFEVPICGHATLAAAKAIMLSKGVDAVDFQTTSEGVITARTPYEDWIEIQIPASGTDTLPSEEVSKLQGMVAKALKQDGVKAKFIGQGENVLKGILLVELDESVQLEGAEVDTEALVSPSVSNISSLIFTIPFAPFLVERNRPSVQCVYHTCAEGRL